MNCLNKHNIILKVIYYVQKKQKNMNIFSNIKTNYSVIIANNNQLESHTHLSYTSPLHNITSSSILPHSIARIFYNFIYINKLF